MLNLVHIPAHTAVAVLVGFYHLHLAYSIKYMYINTFLTGKARLVTGSVEGSTKITIAHVMQQFCNVHKSYFRLKVSIHK